MSDVCSSLESPEELVNDTLNSIYDLSVDLWERIRFMGTKHKPLQLDLFSRIVMKVVREVLRKYGFTAVLNERLEEILKFQFNITASMMNASRSSRAQLLLLNEKKRAINACERLQDEGFQEEFHRVNETVHDFALFTSLLPQRCKGAQVLLLRGY